MHGYHTALYISVKAKDNEENLPTSTSYLNSIKTYKGRLIANFSSCPTIELSKLLTSCLTAIRKKSVCAEKKYLKDLVRIYFRL